MSSDAYEFPFFGAGDAGYYDTAEMIVLFEREPSETERDAIEGALPPPFADTAGWSGRRVYLCMEGIHFAVASEYAVDPDSPDAEIDIEREMEEQEMGFTAPASLLEKFEADIERWLKTSHRVCPILVAYRREDGEGGGTELSKWHEWSVAKTPALLPHLRSLLPGNEDTNTYLLDGILGMADDAGIALPDEFFARVHPGVKEREALEAGDIKRLRELLGSAPSEETLKVLTDDLDDALRSALLGIYEVILDAPSVHYTTVAQMVHAALLVGKEEAPDPVRKRRADAVIERIHRELEEDGDANYLNAYAHRVMMEGDYAIAIPLFDILIQHELTDLSTYCNALYAVQNDNSGLGVDPVRHRRFVEACLPYAERNPPILTNAAAVYVELGEPDSVFEALHRALELGSTSWLMLKDEPMFGDLFEEERFRDLFARAHEVAEAAE